jgi:hypothetical protein
MASEGSAHAQTTAAFRSLIAQAAKPALAELEALRVALDARCESLSATLEGAARIDLAPLHELVDRLTDAAAAEARAATAKADAAAAEARAAAAEACLARDEAQARLEREHGDARAQLELVRAEADAIRADRDAQQEAASDELTQLLAETHAQLEATRLEAEQSAAEIDRLRAELEETRLEMRRAQADARRLEQLQSPPAATYAAPGVSAADPSAAMCRRVDEAANLSQVLDALLDGVGAVFPRAALFVVKAQSKRLQGWRSIGFGGAAAITREFEFSLTTDSPLTRAVNAGRVVFTGDAPPDASPAAGPAEPWTMSLPLMAGHAVVAVVYADDAGRTGDQAASFDRKGALEATDLLVRRAGERLVALTTPAMLPRGSGTALAEQLLAGVHT